MPERNGCDYRPVMPTECTGSVEPEKPRAGRTTLFGSVVSGIGWAVTTALLIGILWTLSQSSQACSSHGIHHGSFPAEGVSPYPRTWANCGSTPAEARQRGCKFDILSFAWQLPECYDEKIMGEFLGEKDWELFQYTNGSSPMSLEAALSGEFTLYVTEEYHHVHCMYMWRQMHRAFTIQKYIDSHLNDYHHTLHCHHIMLAERFPPASIGAIGELKYPDCQAVL